MYRRPGADAPRDDAYRDTSAGRGMFDVLSDVSPSEIPVAALIVLSLLVSLAMTAVLAFGVVTTTRMGRRKGYRGPFLGFGLGAFATVMALGAIMTAALNTDWIGNPLLLVG